MRKYICFSMLFITLVINLSAQTWSAQGFHHQRESEALNQAREKLLWQIELTVSSISAFSAILDEQGNLMDFDPYSESRQNFDTPVQVLNAKQTNAARAHINSPFAVTLSYQTPASIDAYKRGLNQVANLLKESLKHLQGVSNLDEAEFEQKTVIAYLVEYQKYRNMAVLHGLTENQFDSVPLLIADLEHQIAMNQNICDTIERLTGKVLNYFRPSFDRSGASIFIEAPFLVSSQSQNSFSNMIKQQIESKLSLAKLKYSVSERSARWLLRSNYVVLKDSSQNVMGMDLYFSLISNSGPEKGIIKERLTLRVLNQVFDSYEF